ncbi:hypothetical protein KDAU_68680 [Dictyobacter aurantiacus]|uniref:Uncharacterized protein n=1 Tax=Dictyobacter aurantiacus TaxID=1936993 RepID=A0A401ZRM7_9CHLR|nr:hypothetical protein KDAU_68680 [Dictyobacter aurantiacus]
MMPSQAIRAIIVQVHHLRDLTIVEKELKQNWAKDTERLLLDVKEAVDTKKADNSS